MDLKDLQIYKLSMELGEEIWSTVAGWEYFPKSSIGNQWVRSADSIAANISEGFGRYHFKEKKNFGYYARGSLFETATWLDKAHNRQLISQNDHEKLSADLKNLGIKLNNYIKSIGSGKQQPNDH